MKKLIDFPPYSEAQIVETPEDGSVICNLSGDGYRDSWIVFPAGSPILSLTQQEIEEFKDEQEAAFTAQFEEV